MNPWESDTDTAELRSVAFTDLEVEPDGSKFSGYAAVFGEDADLGGFTESIARGAFRKVLSAGENVPMCWNHLHDYPLATTKAGTLTLAEDTKGLRVDAELGSDFMSDYVRERVRRGEVAGMSYGFVSGRDLSRIELRGNRPHRELLGFKKLLDVSPTYDPTYAGTSAELRAAISATGWPQEILDGVGPQIEEAVVGLDDPDAEEARASGPCVSVAAARHRLTLIQLKGDSP